MNQIQHPLTLQCALTGMGAWGPGFNDWPSLKALLLHDVAGDEATPITSAPKPEVIPANERRRAPLPVKAAVDVSWQALQHSGIPVTDVACVFGSGLGDTDITDYMCRVLTTEQKQLSPTKFHNSVHNAAAGYWTISTHCMKSANSIAAYQMTAGLALLEGITQCVLHNEPVLITLFDTAAQDTYRQIFSCDDDFAAALLISPLAFPAAQQIATLTLTQDVFSENVLTQEACMQGQLEWQNTRLKNLYEGNPAAKILYLLKAIAQFETASNPQSVRLAISPSNAVKIALETPHL